MDGKTAISPLSQRLMKALCSCYSHHLAQQHPANLKAALTVGELIAREGWEEYAERSPQSSTTGNKMER